MNSTTNKSQYISLAEAAAHSPYTQEYLSLRARQGKLRAIKQGRNWVTTLGWLDDYLHQVDESKSQLREVVVADLPPAAADTDFAFRDTSPVTVKKPTEPVASITEDHLATPLSTFSWAEEKEPARLPYAHQKHFEQLQRRIDAKLEADQPVIAVADLDANSDVDEAPKLIPAHASHGSFEDTLMSFVRPALAVASFVLVISMLAIFDGPLQIRHNIAVGTGVTLSNIGNSLIAIGLEQNGLVANADTSYGQAVNQGAGQVAGATIEKENPGFWATVWRGALTVFGLN